MIAERTYSNPTNGQKLLFLAISVLVALPLLIGSAIVMALPTRHRARFRYCLANWVGSRAFSFLLFSHLILSGDFTWLGRSAGRVTWPIAHTFEYVIKI